MSDDGRRAGAVSGALTVRVRFDDGRVLTFPKATPEETWAGVVESILRGHDMAGEWQGIHVHGPAASSMMLVRASCVVAPPRVVRS